MCIVTIGNLYYGTYKLYMMAAVKLKADIFKQLSCNLV